MKNETARELLMLATEVSLWQRKPQNAIDQTGAKSWLKEIDALARKYASEEGMRPVAKQRKDLQSVCADISMILAGGQLAADVTRYRYGVKLVQTYCKYLMTSVMVCLEDEAANTVTTTYGLSNSTMRKHRHYVWQCLVNLGYQVMHQHFAH